ncbi:MAG: hypothetical protein NZ571_10245 [Anaerolineae bacterium]|nr:hypothetical protein [Anaerolineae bacterium]
MRACGDQIERELLSAQRRRRVPVPRLRHVVWEIFHARLIEARILLIYAAHLPQDAIELQAQPISKLPPPANDRAS